MSSGPPNKRLKQTCLSFVKPVRINASEVCCSLSLTIDLLTY